MWCTALSTTAGIYNNISENLFQTLDEMAGEVGMSGDCNTVKFIWAGNRVIFPGGMEGRKERFYQTKVFCWKSDASFNSKSMKKRHQWVRRKIWTSQVPTHCGSVTHHCHCWGQAMGSVCTVLGQRLVQPALFGHFLSSLQLCFTSFSWNYRFLKRCLWLMCFIFVYLSVMPQWIYDFSMLGKWGGAPKCGTGWAGTGDCTSINNSPMVKDLQIEKNGFRVKIKNNEIIFNIWKR